ncbi:MAG: Trk system potassium transporter TrkA [Prevotellaceae bacterium]|jgi:trk system potassium uptake protein TrkA|nr:Trk system potassium transporter TrkA [Prevotellaceae bacterium]
MKIIIVGAGEVGRYVAKLLASERKDVVLLDENPENLTELDNNYDLMTRVGSPTSINDLKLCGLKKNIFIAVTPDESRNITACILANSLGAAKTIARINNYEYLLPDNQEFFRKLGINTLIYPEALAAVEIVDSVKRGWMHEFRSFGNGEMVLIGLKVGEGALILNKPFKTGFFNHSFYRIVAIKRGNRTLIPKGADEIKANDIVYFICPKGNEEKIRLDTAKPPIDIKKLIIMGGGKIAYKTVQNLSDNYSIKIIEKNKVRCRFLAEKSPSNVLIINGDGRNIELMKQEGIADADAFMAVTGNSETNVFACLAAKRFGVRKTIAEVENIDYIDLAESLDIGTIINKKLIAASNIYKCMLDEDALNVNCLTYSDALVVEYAVKKGDKITKGCVRELILPDNVNIGGIIRDGEGFVVDGDTVAHEGDHVVLFCTSASMPKVADFFQ